MGTEVYVKLLTKEEAFERPLGWPSLRSGILKASVQNASVVVRVLSSRPKKSVVILTFFMPLAQKDVPKVTSGIKFAKISLLSVCKFYAARIIAAQ
jgi:hypothetical protein